MIKTKKFLIRNCAFVIVLVMLVLPAVSFAEESKGLVPCDGSEASPCDFKALMTLINTMINFILFKLAIPIAAIMFFYAGFKMVTSGGSTEARGKAKSIFTSTVFGLVIAAAAWLIVHLILSILGYNGAWIGL